MADTAAVHTVFSGDAGPIGTAISEVITRFNKLAIAQKVSQTALKRTAIGLAGVALVTIPAVKEAIRFNSEMAELQKLLGQGLGRQVAEDMARLSTELPLARKELVSVAAAATRLGVRGRANIREFTTVMAEIGVATDLSAETAAESFARIAEVTNTPITRVRDLGNVANELSNTMATLFSEIIQGAGEISPALAPLGATADQIFAIAAATNEVNISISRGSRQIRSFIQLLSSPDKLEEFSSIIGVTKEEFLGLLNTDTIGLIQRFIDVVNEGGEAAFRLNGALTNAARQGIQSLAQNSDGLIEALERANQHMDDSNSLSDEAATFFGTAANRAQLFGNKIDELQRQFGDKLLPVWVKTLEVGNRVLDLFLRFSGQGVSEFMDDEAVNRFNEALEESLPLNAKLQKQLADLLPFGGGVFGAMERTFGEFGDRTQEVVDILRQFEPEARKIATDTNAIAGIFAQFGQDSNFEKLLTDLRNLKDETNAIIGTFRELNKKEVNPFTIDEGDTDPFTDFLQSVDAQRVQSLIKEKLGIDQTLNELGEDAVRRLMEVLVSLETTERGELAGQLLEAQLNLLSNLVPIWEDYARAVDEASEKAKEQEETFNEMEESLKRQAQELLGVASSSARYRVETADLTEEQKAQLLVWVEMVERLTELKEKTDEAAREYERLKEQYQKRIDDLNLVTLQSQFSLLQRLTRETTDAAIDLFEALGSGADNAGEAIVNMIRRIAREILANKLQGFLMSLLAGFVSSPTSPSGFTQQFIGMPGLNSIPLPNIAGKAKGGSVSPNLPFMIGEEGPEVFVPKQAGNIIPNNALGNTVVIEHHYTIHAMDGADVRRVLEREGDYLAMQTASRVARSDMLTRLMSGGR